MATYDEQLDVCKRKIKYASEHLAQEAAKNHTSREGSPMHRVYGCSICFGWHLATKKD